MMRTIRRVLARLSGCVGSRRKSHDARMEQEFSEHIELQTADYVRAGVPADEARRRAILKFGPVEAFKEECRERRGLPMLERFLKDLRCALRTLAHEPAFAIPTTLMLGIGLGSAIAMFSLVDGILLKPLAYRDPERLVGIREIMPLMESMFPSVLVTPYRFIEWRKHCPSIESMALIDNLAANITGLGEPERVDGAAVSPSFFRVLGTDLRLGRDFRDEEEEAGKSSVAVLTDNLWRRKFNSDPHAIGRIIRINGHAHTIIGVLGPEFHFPEFPYIARYPEFLVPKVFNQEDLADRGLRAHYEVVARLKPGVSLRQAVSELESVQRRIEEEAGTDMKLHAAVTPLGELISGKARRALLLLMGAVGILALIICVNLANLLLARGERRLHEFGIRAALGAGRIRLATCSLADAVILAAAGGAVAFGLASAAIKVLARTDGLNIPRLNEVSLDGRAVLFAVALAALTSLVFGLLPAWRTGKSDPQSALRSGNRNVADSFAGRRTRSTLVACEVGLCVPLLVMAGLLTNSFVRLITVDKGFTAPKVLAVDTKLAGDRYADDAARDRFFRDLLTELESTPGVSAAAVTSGIPLQGESGIGAVSTTANAPHEAMTLASLRFISPDYFRTMGIPLRAGRTFSDNDRDRHVAILSSRLCAVLWPGLNPMGRKFTRGGDHWFEVIGVASDVCAAPEKPLPLMIYRPYWDETPYSTILVARADETPQSIQSALRSAIRRADPDVPIPRMRTMAEVLDERVVTRRFETTLAGAFALIALVVASLGIYAVVSYSVARRTSEIGVRTALGAKTGHIYRIVLVQGLAPVAIGLLVGIPCALAGARQLAGMLYGVRPNDSATISAAVLTLAMVAVAACLVPARRAARIDPVISLKYE